MKLQNEARTTVKSFEFKKFNRSVLYRLALDPLADWAAARIPDHVTPTMISLGALGSAFLSYLFATTIGSSRLSCALMLVLLFCYQLLDNLNLKQALKHGGINLLTVYVDHVCDALACSFIVMGFSCLLDLSVVQCWFVLLGFALLPVYIEHLRMYYADKLEFEAVNPVDEGTMLLNAGLVLLQVLCLFGLLFGGDLWETETILGVELRSLLLFVFTVLLVVYLSFSIKKIVEHNSNPHDLSLKNLLVMVVVLQVFLEIAVLTNTLNHGLTLGLLQLAFSFINTLLVGTVNGIAGRLIIAYGAMEKFNQVSIDFLLLTLGAIAFSSLEFIFQISEDTYAAEIFAWSAFAGALGYFLFSTYRTYNELASILSQ